MSSADQCPTTGPVTLAVDGQEITLNAGTTLASGLIPWLEQGFRRSLQGEPRSPLCGMGVCFECRVLVDGQRRLACQVLCQDGMQITTEGGMGNHRGSLDEVENDA